MIRAILLTIFTIFMLIGKVFQCNAVFKLFNAHVLLCSPHPLVVCVVCSPVIQQSPKHLLRTMEEKRQSFLVIMVTAAIHTCTGMNKKAMVVLWSLLEC